MGRGRAAWLGSGGCSGGSGAGEGICAGDGTPGRWSPVGWRGPCGAPSRQEAALDGWWQLLHRTVLHAEGLAFDGAEGTGGLSKHVQLGFCILDKLICVFHSSRRRRSCNVDCSTLFAFTQFTALQLVCQLVGFLAHSLQLVSGQGAPARPHASFLELRVHMNRDALLCVCDCAHKHLVLIFVTVAAAEQREKNYSLTPQGTANKVNPKHNNNKV